MPVSVLVKFLEPKNDAEKLLLDLGVFSFRIRQGAACVCDWFPCLYDASSQTVLTAVCLEYQHFIGVVVLQYLFICYQFFDMAESLLLFRCPFLVRFLIGSEISESFGRNFARYDTKLSRLLVLVMLCGGGMSVTTFTLDGSGFKPSLVIKCPMNLV